MKAITALLILIAVNAIPPNASSETMGWDYTLTYEIGSSATAYSVTGIFASHPECSAWEPSTSVNSTAIAAAEKHVYRVSLATRTIEQSVQTGTSVSTTTLTCPGGGVVMLNPANMPTYLSYDNDCTGTNSFVGQYSNVLADAPVGGTQRGDDTYRDLSARPNVCVVAKAGSPGAPTPYTGRVASFYGYSSEYCDNWGCYPNFLEYGRVCTPLMVGGVAVGRLNDGVVTRPCDTIDHPPSPQDRYAWGARAEDLVGGAGFGVGSWGGQWLT